VGWTRGEPLLSDDTCNLPQVSSLREGGLRVCALSGLVLQSKKYGWRYGRPVRWKMKVKDYLVKLEDNLMLGSGRWVADFNESFWQYPMGDLVFDMVITAKVRPKGFFLSKVAAWLIIPNYHVACFAYSKDPELKRLHEILTTISKFLREEELAWAWLVIPHEGSFSRKARAVVENENLCPFAANEPR